MDRCRPRRAPATLGANGASHLGSYLAGRVARGQHDTLAAADYYSSALVRDPDNEVLIEQALLMDATEARWEQALILADRLAKTQPTHRMARLVLALSAAKSGRYAEAQEHFKASGTGLIGELTSAMGRAWVSLAEGNVKARRRRHRRSQAGRVGAILSALPQGAHQRYRRPARGSPRAI